MNWRRIRRFGFMLFAWNGLVAVHFALRLLGYRRLVRLLARLSPAPVRDAYQPRARRAARLIERVTAWRIKPPGRCLTRSILLWWSLRWMGIASLIRNGVRRNAGGDLEFHAWVEQGGIVVNDSPDHIAGFEPLWPALSPESFIQHESR